MAYQETVERIKSQRNYNICGFCQISHYTKHKVKMQSDEQYMRNRNMIHDHELVLYVTPTQFIDLLTKASYFCWFCQTKL